MHPFTFLFSIIVAVAASDEPLSKGLHLSRAEVRIVNGRSAELGQFPWQAWVECIRFNLRSTGCGGSLISDRHVLTAAHCVDRVILCRVSLGLISLRGGGGVSSLVYSTRIKVHGGYNTSANDIALILLRTPVKLTANIRPIRLPTELENRTLNGASAVISGWGKTKDDESSVHNYLQFAEVRIMAQEDCKAFYRNNFDFTVGDGHVCTDFSTSNVCNGDSGGPLAIQDEDKKNWTLIGIASLGVSPCESGAPSVFTRVSSYTHWIGQYYSLTTNSQLMFLVEEH